MALAGGKWVDGDEWSVAANGLAGVAESCLGAVHYWPSGLLDVAEPRLR